MPPARRDLPGHGPYRRGALIAGLLGPDLPGAACRGRAPLHDDLVAGETDEQREARHHHAQAVCARCPALLTCRAALADLGPIDVGVWAGVIRAAPRRGRPAKAS